jgi:hypothetical protein
MRIPLAKLLLLSSVFALGFSIATVRERARCATIERDRQQLYLVASHMSEVAAECVGDLAATIGVWTRPVNYRKNDACMSPGP